jgi:hypothetical protein
VSQTTLYAQNDIHAKKIPVEWGGCGQEHLRPIVNGIAARQFRLDCPPCEAVLSGAGKPKILKYEVDQKTGRVLNQVRVADADPQWSSTPDTIPLTWDEMRSRGVKLEKGENQLRALEALIALRNGGVDLMSRPEVMFYLQESGLPLEVLQGTVVCANNHDNAPSAKFCGECGISMTARGSLEQAPAAAPSPVVGADLARLHPQTLKKRLREKGLPDDGSKDELIRRLQAA